VSSDKLFPQKTPGSYEKPGVLDKKVSDLEK